MELHRMEAAKRKDENIVNQTATQFVRLEHILKKVKEVRFTH